MEGTRGCLSGQPTQSLGCPDESCLWSGWSMNWIWFFWSPVRWGYRYLLLGGYPFAPPGPSPAARSLGPVTGSDRWAASTLCHASQWSGGCFPPHPQLSSPSSMIGDRSVESPHGGWLPGDGLSIVTEGKCILAVYWEEMGEVWVLSRSGPPCRISMREQNSPVTQVYCLPSVNFWTDILILRITSWIESGIKISVLQKRKLRLVIYLRDWFQSVFSILLHHPEQKFSENRVYLPTELISKELLILTRSQGTAHHCFCLFIFNHEGKRRYMEGKKERNLKL